MGRNEEDGDNEGVFEVVKRKEKGGGGKKAAFKQRLKLHTARTDGREKGFSPQREH